MTSKRIHIGKIVGVHGIKGFVALKIFSNDPQSVLNQGTVTNKDGTASFNFTFKFAKKGVFIFALDGTHDRTAAELLKGTDLYVLEDNLQDTSEDEFYYKDLQGCDVFDQNNTLLGQVLTVQNYGAGDLLEIQHSDKTCLIPFNDHLIQNIAIPNKTIKVDIPDGLLDL